MSELKLFTRESVVEHAKANPNLTFISIHDNVYDVTSFLDEHPGGEETLKEYQIKTDYKDASESFEDTGHSMDARDMMKKYQIGLMESKKEKPKTEKKQEQSNAPKESSNLMTLIVPAIIVVVVGLVYQYISYRS